MGGMREVYMGGVCRRYMKKAYAKVFLASIYVRGISERYMWKVYVGDIYHDIPSAHCRIEFKYRVSLLYSISNKSSR